jgi:hypothetical protein
VGVLRTSHLNAIMGAFQGLRRAKILNGTSTHTTLKPQRVKRSMACFTVDAAKGTNVKTTIYAIKSLANPIPINTTRSYAHVFSRTATRPIMLLISKRVHICKSDEDGLLRPDPGQQAASTNEPHLPSMETLIKKSLQSQCRPYVFSFVLQGMNRTTIRNDHFIFHIM